MYAIGIDSGSSATKGVLFDGTSILAHVMVPTGYNPTKTMKDLYLHLKDIANKSSQDLQGKSPGGHSEIPGAHSDLAAKIYTVTTGYGRDLLPEADKKVTEISCHAKGVSFLSPGSRTVIDIGGQDSKVILMDRDLNVVDFLMNDKCAAGTGRFVEVIMRILHRDFDDLDGLIAIANADEVAPEPLRKAPIKISSMCTVFAESEVISLLAQQAEPAAIAKGVIDSICGRTAIFASRLPMEPSVFFSGGLAQSEAMGLMLGQALGMPVVSHALCQYAGAIGAAVIGSNHIKRAIRHG